MGRDRDSGINRAGRRDGEEKMAGKRDLRTPIVDPLSSCYFTIEETWSR